MAISIQNRYHLTIYFDRIWLVFTNHSLKEINLFLPCSGFHMSLLL